MPKVIAIVDLQFGSTGKGSLAAKLSTEGYWRDIGQSGPIRIEAAVTNWGPNAGHTSVYPDGAKVVRTMLANSVHRGDVERVYIGPGSAINIDELVKEAMFTHGNGKRFQVYVHAHAAIVRDEDRHAESVHNRIGSTQKGTAQAWINKMMRDPESEVLAENYVDELWRDSRGILKVVDQSEYLRLLGAENYVLAEGCQGYSLGISSGFWPYVTSRECTVAQLLSDTLLPPSSLEAVYGCMRVHPIRVANRFNAAGDMTGFSGPHYEDQNEISFESIGQKTEYTTVTKLPRRIFSFSMQQVREAITVNGADRLFVNFLNYLPNGHERQQFLQNLWRNIGKVHMEYTGFGPSTGDIMRAAVTL